LWHVFRYAEFLDFLPKRDSADTQVSGCPYFFSPVTRVGKQEIFCYNNASMGNLTNGLTALFAILAIPALAALVFIAKFICQQTIGKKLKTTLKKDYQNEAARFEKAGKFVSAARVCETKLKDLRKAAVLYERGGDYRKASSLYDFLGISDKAKERDVREGRQYR
jgi:hypothetical protein